MHDAGIEGKKRFVSVDMKKRKKVPRWKRILRIRRRLMALAVSVFVLVATVTVVREVKSHDVVEDTQQGNPEWVLAEMVTNTEEETRPVMPGGVGYHAPNADGTITVGDVSFVSGYHATEGTGMVDPDQNDMVSRYMILVNENTGEIVAGRQMHTRISPASMTKILTVLVAAEHLENEEELKETVQITLDITDYAYSHDCSSVGYLEGETATVEDLFYGTILPSGGDAALALAIHVAGSQEAFVDLMNDKIAELGLQDTHFTNCIGLYDKEHYSSVYDMSMILKAAVENDFCREVLSAHVYTTSISEQHPEGMTISNWFLRRIEDKDSDGLVLCAKTGFVNQSGSCAASYAIQEDGTPYICVTADASGGWRCIYDHVAAYLKYTP